MNQPMTAEACWMQFCKTRSNPPPHYDAWSFGDTPEMADRLGKLVVDGIKTATASCYKLYEMDGDILPKQGEYSVILGGSGQALCVIETTRVDIVPFDQVSAEQAWCEGEGDRSLSYWRDVHEAFFSRELEEKGMAFDPGMHVVCEKFHLVYVPEI
ncbi:ASCH domain-containing protein [Sporolactobacillus shoreae]|nr:ASCH domain-containing protein [Sporolactobacillus shoreae]